jgi:Uncharacterized conserved protein
MITKIRIKRSNNMTGLIFGGIAPHGSQIIEELAGDELELFKPTRTAMETLGKMVKEQNPDTIVIITPHGLKLKGYNAVYISEFCSGTLSDNGGTIGAEFKCDTRLAEDILAMAASEGIPCAGANYGTSSGPSSNMPADWGVLIPLWYMGARDQNKPEIVVIGPTRDIPLQQMAALGRVIAQAAEKSGKRVALIASADQAHAHDPKGIYGYDSAAPEYDKQIVSIIKENRLEKLLGIDLGFIEKAKPDSLWQMLILYGATQVVPMKGTLLSYQVPTYFGMLVASYKRI